MHFYFWSCFALGTTFALILSRHDCRSGLQNLFFFLSHLIFSSIRRRTAECSAVRHWRHVMLGMYSTWNLYAPFVSASACRTSRCAPFRYIINLVPKNLRSRLIYSLCSVNHVIYSGFFVWLCRRESEVEGKNSRIFSIILTYVALALSSSNTTFEHWPSSQILRFDMFTLLIEIFAIFTWIKRDKK